MPNPDNTEDDNSDEEIVKQEIHRNHNEPTEEDKQNPYILPNRNNEGSEIITHDLMTTENSAEMDVHESDKISTEQEAKCVATETSRSISLPKLRSKIVYRLNTGDQLQKGIIHIA